MRTVKMNIEETKEYQQLCKYYGVKKQGCHINGKICIYGNEVWKNCASEDDRCPEIRFELPKFTQQKQLELIKLIGNNGEFKYEEYYFDGEEDCLCVAVINNTHYDASGDDFDIALVRLLIRLHDVLNKSKVKEILEG